MVIDANLNLVLPVRSGEDGEPLLYAYHTSISGEVFTANYRIIAETNAMIWGKGLKFAATSGVRVANLMLLDVSKADAQEREIEDSGPALLSEIKRLTLILAPSGQGFDLVPVDIAIARGFIDKDDWSEAEASIVFFTLGYAMARRATRKTFAGSLASVIGGSMTSLSPSDYLDSLRRSKPDESSEATVTSSVPS